MQWLRRLFGKEEQGEQDETETAPPSDDGEPPPSPPAPSPSPPPAKAEPAALVALRHALEQRETGEQAARLALRALAGSPDERRALDAVRVVSRGLEVPEPVRVAAAELHLQRGEGAEALTLLEKPATLEGLLVRAEALAARDELGAACAELERVLARDIQAPGVRERLERWRARLGNPLSEETPAGTDATLFAAQPRVPFRLLSEAGRGGAAVVYEAEDEALGRKVALKMYHRPADARSQIEREACLASAIAGRGVVRVFDADLDAGWVALEWAGRGTLRDAIRARDLALLSPASSWLEPLVEALARLHQHGWAHGDLKPGNVLFRAQGEPLLSDFGLARRPGEAFTGGTIGYLSPERLSRRSAQLADDVYALGRLIEDVLSATGEGGFARQLADRCLSEARPASAVGLLG